MPKRKYSARRRSTRPRVRRRLFKRSAISRLRRRTRYRRLRSRRHANFSTPPRCKIVKLRYCDTVSLDPAAGTRAIFDFRCNSIYDPQYSTGGHQPLDHDRLAQLYGTYEVIGSKITVVFAKDAVQNAGSPSDFALVGIETDDDLVYELNCNTIREARIPHKVLGARFGTQTCTAKWSLTKELCRTQLTHADYTSVFGASPTKEPLFRVWASALNTTTADPAVISCVCTIDYIVRLTKRIDIEDLAS